MSVRSLSATEAAERGTLLDVHRYDLLLDLTGLRDGDALRAVSTITFTSTSPGSTTFVDCLGDVEEATLNGRPVPLDAAGPGRLTVPDLAADNVLVVRSTQRRTASGQGVHRVVDPADGEVYVWTSFEPDDARVVFACFDQPDLKAVFAITVRSPQAWTVTSNCGDADVTTVGDLSTWVFPDTPPLSTYVPVVNAGPFYQLRSSRNGLDLGLYSRRSLAPMLDRDAEELFDLTARGLGFFGEQFAMPFPQPRYDQVFVPELGGAMENYGCVTWSDSFLFRDPPSHAERERRAMVLLHEMAHMWFGDIVTMRWWDGLWLNESFAQWACAWAAAACTEFTDVWAGMLVGEEQDAYAADAAPTTHPIHQHHRDVAAAAAAFDDITYPKGAAVLRQLVTYVGEPAFVTALREYFRKHAWGSSTLDDLVAEVADASGQDLSGWVAGWLGTAGTDLLAVERDGEKATLVVSAPSGRDALPHRVDVGSYAHRGNELVLLRTDRVQVSGERTDFSVPADADAVLPNDGDLTFARTRPDPASWRLLVEHAGELPTAVGRALVVTTAWGLLYDGALPARELVTCAAGVLAHERVDSVVEPVVNRAVEAADYWSPPAERDALLGQVADVCLRLTDDPGRRVAGARGLARTATTAEQLAALEHVATDPDVRWRRLARLAELELLDASEVDRLLAEDPNPEARFNALVVRAATPSADSKADTWRAVIVDRTVPLGLVSRVGRAFWRPGQDELVAPYAERFVSMLPELGDAGMLWALSLSGGFFPRVGGDGLVERLDAAAGADDVSALVRETVRRWCDERRRMEAARHR